MSQPRWDPDERRWMLDDEHSSDAPRRRRAPITDQRPSSGIDVREFDARAGRGSMTVAELTHADLDEDRDPRFGSRDHDRRGSGDEQGFGDRWTPDVPRPSTPGRNGFRDVAEAAVDRWRDEEAGYDPGRNSTGRYDSGRYDSGRYGAGTAGQDLTGRYSDARYVRDVLDAGRNGSYRDGGSRDGDGRFDADLLGWGRTSSYGNGPDARDRDDYADDHASAGHDGGRYPMDALDPGWRIPSDGATERRDALDGGADDRYADPYTDDPYAGRTRNGAYGNGSHGNGSYRNGSDRSVPTNGHSGRDDVDRYEDVRYEHDRYEPRDADRNGRDRHDTGRYAPLELDRRDTGYLDAHGPDGDDPFYGGRNGMSRNGNGHSVRNDLDVDRGEAARLEDGPYGYGPADGRTDRHGVHDDAYEDGAYSTGGRRNGAGRVDRAPYSRPRRVADGYEPEPRDEFDDRAYDDRAYDDRTYDDRAYDDRADGHQTGGHVVDDGYGSDPGGPAVGVGRAARRRARELEEDRTETREFGLPADEAADLDASEDPDGESAAADGADGAVEDGEGRTRRKRRRRWPWVVGGVAVAGGLAVPAVLALQDGAQGDSVSSVTVDSAGFGTGPASPVNGNPDAPAAGQVVYQLTGSGTASTVTYGRGTSISQVSGAQLPWEQTMTGGNGGSEYTLTATTAQGSDEISCRISVDGAVIAEQKASGDYAAVSCTGRR